MHNINNSLEGAATAHLPSFQSCHLIATVNAKKAEKQKDRVDCSDLSGNSASFIKSIAKYIYTPIKTIELGRLEHVPERIAASYTYISYGQTHCSFLRITLPSVEEIYQIYIASIYFFCSYTKKKKIVIKNTVNKLSSKNILKLEKRKFISIIII
jgi:hypothetical protein